jgi:4-azaleucine resistance transporter AzlC
MTGVWKDVLRLTAPVGMGYLPTGFAFGVLATQAGLPAHLAVAMSVFIFAGALQFAAIPLVLGAGGFVTIALTTLLINLRHVLYAIPLLDQLPVRLISKAYVVSALTDENYSVLTTVPEDRRRQLAPWITLVNHGYWIGGTLIGAVLGLQAGRWIPHLDFALPALFTILAIEQYLSRRRWQPVAIGLVSYLIARAVLPGYALISALAMGLMALVVFTWEQASSDELTQPRLDHD